MKKLTILFFAVIVCTTISFAQDSTTKMNKMHHQGMKMGKDCVMMEDGKMMMMKGGNTTAMDQDMTLSDGSTVMKDGMLKMKDGTTKQLKNGDHVYMDGKYVSGMKKSGMKKKPTE